MVRINPEVRVSLFEFPVITDVTPEEFELLVRSWAESASSKLEKLEVTHHKTIPGKDGEYTFDVVATFSAVGGAKFTVLIECKKHKHSIKREVVQVLNDKLRSVGAHKGIVVATAPFQAGALSYAKSHGIALAQVANGALMYLQASAGRNMLRIYDLSKRDFCGVFFAPTDQSLPQPFNAEKPYGWSSYVDSET